MQKRKTYLALCISPSKPFTAADLDKLASIKDLELQQKTPIRVLHRRPNATRPRTVYKMSAEQVSGFFVHFFPGEISGKIPRKILPPKMFGKNGIFHRKSFETSLFQEIPRNFPRKKMYEKMAQGEWLLQSTTLCV
jgi:hypothetical protein